MYFKKNPKSNWLSTVVKEKLLCNKSYIIYDSHNNRYRRNRILRYRCGDIHNYYLSMRYQPVLEREEVGDEGQVEENIEIVIDPYVTRSSRVIRQPDRYGDT